MTRPHRARRALARLAVCAGACVLLAPVACTSSEDQFCGRLRDEYRLDELVTAIQRQDQRRITQGLEGLRELQDVAPAAIYDDFRAVVDAVSAAVRAVTKAPGADGEKVPVDLTLLGQQLAAITQPAQHVADYADRNCGLKLNS
ncbi:MAG: hypothetical protein U0Q22_04905 [Acidimicrobiales bacterium]